MLYTGAVLPWCVLCAAVAACPSDQYTIMKLPYRYTPYTPIIGVIGVWDRGKKSTEKNKKTESDFRNQLFCGDRKTD